MKVAAESVWRDPKHPYWTAPRDRWLAAGVATDAGFYPCRCVRGRKCQRSGWNTCPCVGRSEPAEMLPSWCCALVGQLAVASMSWVSAETELKERDFRGLLGIHLNICNAIRSRPPARAPYLYVDLHGGPGDLRFGGRAFPGSPLIFLDEVGRRGMEYRSAHFESDVGTAAALRAAVKRSPSASLVRNQRFEDGVVDLVRSLDERRTMLGLIYSDPIRDPIPVEHFNQLADLLPRVDLLAYVAANDQYKRPNGAGSGHGRRIADDIAAVNKKVVLVRAPTTAHQWTFVLWSNWTNLPKWERAGFYRLDSAKGQAILRELNYTKAELHEMDNEPLPLNPPYRTYREYLRHPRFLRVRAQVFARAEGKCERCGLRPPRDPHHLRYPPWGEFDVPENLIAICHECHCELHGKAS